MSGQATSEQDVDSYLIREIALSLYRGSSACQYEGNAASEQQLTDKRLGKHIPSHKPECLTVSLLAAIKILPVPLEDLTAAWRRGS